MTTFAPRARRYSDRSGSNGVRGASSTKPLALVLTLVVSLTGLTNPAVAQAPTAPGAAPGPSPAASDPAALDVAAAEASLHGGPSALLSNPGWHEANALFHPQARYGAAEAYDPATGEVVLFGGANGSSYLNDTWTYFASAGGSGFWREVPEPVAPEPRANAAVAFDGSTGNVILTGGMGVSGPLNSTWEYNGSGWSNLSATGIPALVGAGMAYDEASGRLLLFGGLLGASVQSGLYQLVGSRWSSVPGTGTPPARTGATFVFDPARAGVLLSGGRGASGLLTDTWELRGSSWMPVANVGAAPAVVDASAVMDAADGLLLVVGGNNSGGPSNLAFELPTSAGWSIAPAITAPAARVEGSAAFDEALGAVVLFGGWKGSSVNDTWRFALRSSPPQWKAINGSVEPPRRTDAGFSYDPSIGAVLMFGGLAYGASGPGTGGDIPHPFGGGGAGSFLNDTWAFQGGNWSDLSPTVSPGPRRGPMMSYDPRDGYLLLFGGSNGTAYLNDTWAFHGGTWSLLHPGDSPSARRGGGMTYDAADAELLLYGGHNGSLSQATYTYFGDLWAFAGGNWSELLPTSAPPENPPAEAGPLFAYDPGSGIVVLFGGYRALDPNGSGEAPLNYTYTFQGGQWTNLSSTSAAHSPPPRDGSAFVFDEATSALVTWGGDDQALPLTDVWTFRDGSWGETCAKCAPPGQAANHGAWDPAMAALITWGVDVVSGTSVTSVDIGVFALSSSVVPTTADSGAPVPFLVQAEGGVQPWVDRWSFGDGSSPVIGFNVTHLFTASGRFTVNLSARDVLGGAFNLSQNISVNSTLRLNFFAGIWGPGLNQARLSATVAGGTPPYAYTFDFRDGSSLNFSGVPSTHEVVLHRYAAGNYAPVVSVSDATGDRLSGGSTSFSLPATPPTLQATANRTVVTVGGTVDLSASLVDLYAPDNVSWTAVGVGVGAFSAPWSVHPILRARLPGTIQVTVTTLDQANLTTTASINLTIVPELEPSFTITVGNRIACPVVPNSSPVELNASASGGEAPYTFEWSGPNANSSGPDTVLRLTPGQSIVVLLTVRDSDGNNASLNRSVLVPPATCPPALSV
ncbi:MAG: PKD domain-containing protein, partial [Thermoplasmata archaeon]|nr:PKD domain-containing protein [Thermoplasmata archaeon]